MLDKLASLLCVLYELRFPASDGDDVYIENAEEAEEKPQYIQERADKIRSLVFFPFPRYDCND